MADPWITDFHFLYFSLFPKQKLLVQPFSEARHHPDRKMHNSLHRKHLPEVSRNFAYNPNFHVFHWESILSLLHISDVLSDIVLFFYC